LELSSPFHAYDKVSGGDRAVTKMWAPCLAAFSLLVTSTSVLASPTKHSSRALAVATASVPKSSHPAQHQAKKSNSEASEQKDAASTDERTSAFTNNHYVLTGTLPTNGFRKDDPTVFIVDKGSHRTYVLQEQDNRIVRVLTVSNAIGNADKPTPPGRYTIVNKKMYPQWVPPKTIKHKPVAPYNQTHENPLGVAAIYLNKFDIDLHGTNQPDAIRRSISHGCVRHSNSDILKLYSMASNGDVVYIVNHFRGKVLNQADFFAHRHNLSKNKHVASDQGAPEPVTKDENAKHRSNSVTVFWYTIDT